MMPLGQALPRGVGGLRLALGDRELESKCTLENGARDFVSPRTEAARGHKRAEALGDKLNTPNTQDNGWMEKEKGVRRERERREGEGERRGREGEVEERADEVGRSGREGG